jgi:predicted phage terminase large subunit-like protein
MDFVDTEDTLVAFTTKWRPKATIIEEKANGAALISRLKKRIQGLIPFVPDKYGDKMTRAQGALPVWAAGNVWLPTNEHLATVGEYVAELRAFPKGATKDRVDAMSQLFQWLEENQMGSTAALNRLMAGALQRR